MAAAAALNRMRSSVLVWGRIGLEQVRLWWPGEALYAIRLALMSLAALYVAMALELQTPSWAGWTVLSVSLATRASSLQKSLWRAGSSILGGVVAIGMVAAFAQSTLAFDVALTLWLAGTSAASAVERGQRSYGFALLGYTVPIVTLADVQHPELVFNTAVDRCSTLLLGIACAHVSGILFDRGGRKVSTILATQLEASQATCVEWLETVSRGDEREVPIAPMLALGDAVSDAFTEQPSLQTGGWAVSEVPLGLLQVLHVGLLQVRLGGCDRAMAERLLGVGPKAVCRRLGRADVASRLLRSGRRIGTRHAAPQTLAIDRDGWQAVNMAVRSAIAISLTSGYWYVSDWTAGSDAVTWAALVSALFAGRPNSLQMARTFLWGAVLAAIVGTVVHYTVLTYNGGFGWLAAVLFPLLMLAALGRNDKRAALASGYAMLILTIISPSNVMLFQLDASLNQVVGILFGMGTAVAAFAALPPSASAATRRHRAKRRMARSLRAIACRPPHLLPVEERWLAVMFDRLSQLAPEDAAVNKTGQTILLLGSLLFAIRRADDRLGREAGQVIIAMGEQAGSTVAGMMDRPAHGATQRARLGAITTLLETADFKGWPGLPA